MKYIDVDLLLKEIEKKSHEEQGFSSEDSEYGYRSCARDLLAFINSLQQEQSEVDLEKEIDREWEKCNPTDEGMGVETANIHIEAFDMITRHFYELGFNAKKEE